MSDEKNIQVGPYTGQIAADYRDPEIISQFEKMPDLLAGPSISLLSTGRNAICKVTLSLRGNPLVLVIKRFGRENLLKNLVDRKRGSKARRTWLAARRLKERGVGTPTPVGFLEKWEGSCLLESYYISEFVPEVVSFKHELIRLFKEDPNCTRFMDLLKTVARAVAGMHREGLVHNDLGNQNILLRRSGEGWGEIFFLDLNRARISENPSMRQRARDLSRIKLPSDLLRVFIEMYFDPGKPPEDFRRWERIFRRLYGWHRWSGRYRHPVRAWRNREAEKLDAKYPSEKDMWIWDPKSAQAISVMRPRDRAKYHSVWHHARIAVSAVAGFGPAYAEYLKLLGQCYVRRVEMRGRVGISIGADTVDTDREIDLLDEFASAPTLIRFYSHENEKNWSQALHVADRVEKRGHRFAIALVQDRASALDPGKWRAFVSHVIGEAGKRAEWVEIGHAINRVKWGIWQFPEYRRMFDVALETAGSGGNIRFTGPAVIDFEYPFLMAALDSLPPQVRLQALSHHLYVDRRGAPESRQGGFSTLEKCAMLRAIGRTSGKCEDRVIISEVNWPLRGTGVYSPVTSPYESPGLRFNDPSVTEDEYADYMIRYLLITLCSGMIERVYWWRLVARGFGLVDDTDRKHWRKRPAFRALKYFLDVLGDAAFVEKQTMGNGVQMFVFGRKDGTLVHVGYSAKGSCYVSLPFKADRMTDSTGSPVELSSRESGDTPAVVMTGRPVFLFRRT